MIKVIGLGGGGHSKVVMDALRLAGGYDIIGLVDAPPELHGTTVAGAPILGGDDILPRFRADGVTHAFIGLGGTGSTAPRQRLFDLALSLGFDVISVIHPAATVAESVTPGRGVQIMAGVVINPYTRLGDNVIVNTGAVVDHDCVIGDHVHIAPGACLGGEVTVGDGAHIGIGANVLQCQSIGPGALVGGGTLVHRDVEGGTVVAGVPARKTGGSTKS